jgi:hypothetical protein
MKLIGWNSLLLQYDAREKCCYKYLHWPSYFIALVACTSVLICFGYLCWPSYEGQYESKSLLFFSSETLIMITVTIKSTYVVGDIDNRVHIIFPHSHLHCQHTFPTFVWDSGCCSHKTLFYRCMLITDNFGALVLFYHDVFGRKTAYKGILSECHFFFWTSYFL